MNKERLGMIVREAWVYFCRLTIPEDHLQPKHTDDWWAISEWDKEVDRQIGTAVLDYTKLIVTKIILDEIDELQALWGMVPYPQAKANIQFEAQIRELRRVLEKINAYQPQ